LKAVVRYQALLHCGLEFVSLTSEQQTLIEHWTRRKSVTNPIASSRAAGTQSSAPPRAAASTRSVMAPARKKRSAMFRHATSLVFVAMLLTGGLGWWHWHQAWGELEAQLPASQPQLTQPPALVPAEVMEKRVTHKIEPIYPAAARQAKVQGVVVLDAVIGPDGAVLEVHPVSGPDELTPAAVDAVKWWRFQPYLINGQAVQVKTTLAVDFRGN